MNVAQVQAQCGFGNLDLRPFCVEITQTQDQPPESMRTVVVMWQLYARPNQAVDQTIDPRLVGRIEIIGPCHVLDSAEADWHAWAVQIPGATPEAECQHIFIRPHKDEAIWLDRINKDLPDDLKMLHQQRRYGMYSLTINERLLRSAPESHKELRSVYECNALAMRNMIAKIEKKIASMEVSHQHG